MLASKMLIVLIYIGCELQLDQEIALHRWPCYATIADLVGIVTWAETADDLGRDPRRVWFDRRRLYAYVCDCVEIRKRCTHHA